MKLSILICSIPERKDLLTLLTGHLREQINELGAQREVEIVIDDRPKLSVSVGTKRNDLYARAKGTHSASIDDDDWVPYQYVDRILRAINEKDPDCIGYMEVCKGMNGPGGRDRRAVHSNRYRRWCDNCFGFDHVRTIFHKDPIRTVIAQEIGFQDMRFGEDHDFSRRLKRSGLLKTEVFIDEVMYEYRYQYQEHNIKYGIRG